MPSKFVILLFLNFISKTKHCENNKTILTNKKIIIFRIFDMWSLGSKFLTVVLEKNKFMSNMTWALLVCLFERHTRAQSVKIQFNWKTGQTQYSNDTKLNLYIYRVVGQYLYIIYIIHAYLDIQSIESI